MSAPAVDVLRWGRERARTGPWRGEADAPPPSAEFLRRCLDILASRGVVRVVTGALSPLEQVGFLAAGFDVAERLHLLGIDLAGPPPDVPDGVRLARGRRRDRDDVLAVDRASFSPFWRFDQLGLDDALDATPMTRWRVAVPGPRWQHGRPIAGYAICGRAGSRGFVQRLAVDPGAQRQGTGRRLLLDGLHWMSRKGVQRAVVNTQVGNEAALALYLAVGFTEQPNGLSVLAAGLR
jgi:ribosomal protein S18 acetylase RimI-like enzyme